MKELSEKYVTALEARDWTEMDYTDDGRVELQWYSPAGEDFSICVNVDNFAESVSEYAENFDIDEHVEMWIDARRSGVSGVPSASELVKDSREIKKELRRLAKALRGI